MTWNKKQTTNKVYLKTRKGKVMMHSVCKDYTKRGDITKQNKVLNTKLKYIGRAIVTASIGLTDDQIANMIVYNKWKSGTKKLNTDIFN